MAKELPTQDWKFDPLTTLIERAEHMVGVKTWQNLTMVNIHTGERKNVLDDGDVSCAVVVSVLVASVGLLNSGYAVVDSLEKAMKKHGWFDIEEPVPGAVVFWVEKKGDKGGFTHRHVGICVDEHHAVGNDPVTRQPQKLLINGLRFHNGDPRPVEKVMWHEALSEYLNV